MTSARARPTKMLLTRPVYLGRQVFPDRLHNKLRYSETAELTVVSGFATLVYRANGMFDPNLTGVGHQPMGYDQLNALYDHWTVMNSSIKVNVVDATANRAAVLTLGLYDSSTQPTTNQARESAKSMSSVWTSGGNFRPMIKYFNAKQMFGNNIETNELFRGTTGTDPNEQGYFHLNYYDSSLSSYTQFVTIDIEYTALWSELKNIVSS